MKLRCLPLAAVLALATSLFAAMAQTSTLLPSAGASAPTAAKAGPRALTPAELRDSASPDDLRPEGPVKPQISIPLGKTAPVPLKSQLRAARPGAAASSGGINDAAARCEAQTDEQARAKCRDKFAHEASGR